MFYDNRSRDFSGSPWAFWMGKMHGERGFGHFPGFMGGFGRGGSPFRTGRKFLAADLQLIILALLAEKPCHGYELIKALEERSGGFYVPSPGMIYPALTYLEEIGYATVQEDGNRKLYSITEAGRRHWVDNRGIVDTILLELGRVGAKMEDVRRAFTGEDESEGEEFDARGRSHEFRSARRALKTALHEKHACSSEEATRIAEILRRATEEILNPPPTGERR